MRSFALLTFAFAVGCSSASRTPETPPADPAAPAAEPKAASSRAELALKRGELKSADEDLGRIAAERAELNAQGASEAKTNRMAELARLEAETRQRRLNLETEIARLDKAGSEPAPATDPAAAALEKALAEAKKAEEAAAREKAEAARRKAEEMAAKEREEAEKRRKMEQEAAKPKPPEPTPKPPGTAEPAMPAAEGEAIVFEERWAAVILKVRAELQRYKRW